MVAGREGGCRHRQARGEWWEVAAYAVRFVATGPTSRQQILHVAPCVSEGSKPVPAAGRQAGVAQW